MSESAPEVTSSSQMNFPKMEEEILAHWQKAKIFEKSLDPKKPRFNFYDGPPFATGLPHYGHLLASTLKDVVPRYWTMRGFHVERRWGWDCHGVPIEQEIDKKFQFKSSAEIEKFGIAQYNKECRDIVLRFVSEWQRTINRIGRWADFQNDYKTMDLSFMESVWWIINELWQKGLIYRGFKVMPFSTSLGTPLSNFEAGLNYQDVQDPAITITFPLRGDTSTSFLAWTTTPWTLPSNLALALGEDIVYATIQDPSRENKKFILAEALIEKYFKKDQVQILETKRGSELVGIEYLPLFDFYKDKTKPHFSSLLSAHVTTEAGTGIVHMAPAFGEDDFVACQKLGIKPVCPIDSNGKFSSEIPPYTGMYVKEADKKIISDLKASGRLFKQDTLQHAYPYCYRTDTPLIYRIVGSWFVKVEAVKERLVANNIEHTHWVPEHLREGRFGKWLEGARDWAISRNRFWGNPLPIFESFEDPEDKRDYFCVSSVSELEKLTGKKFSDIHREHLDGIVIEKNGKKYRRVPEVLDCWFESGAMPYAQNHYPFKNKEDFEKIYPADFIAEGLDQTRGWFYTLSVLGTILFDKPPFKNVVVNGLILAEDGKKMSKRLKNYPDPHDVMDQYGADALRLYLIDSPAIRAEELRFSEAGVRDIVRRVILKWWNAYTFFDSYAKVDQYQPSADLLAGSVRSSGNILDRWIISRLQSLLEKIEKEMNQYHLYNVVPELLTFIEELTNTYIRLNRPRFWDEGFTQDKKDAFDTLYSVLLSLSKMMAPFAPFLADHLYLLLTNRTAKESVHLEAYPRASAQLIDRGLESGTKLLEEVIFLGRNLRDQAKVKVKIPLKEIVLVNRQAQVLKNIQPLENYIKSELNVKKITYRNDEQSFVTLSCKPHGPSLGPKVGPKMGAVTQGLAKLSFEDIQRLDSGESLSIEGFTISSTEVRIQRSPVKGQLPSVSSSLIVVALDTAVERDQELEGLAREIVNRIQKFRKDLQLNLADRIQLELQLDGDLREAAEKFSAYIQEQTLATSFKVTKELSLAKTQSFEIESLKGGMGLHVESARP